MVKNHHHHHHLLEHYSVDGKWIFVDACRRDTNPQHILLSWQVVIGCHTVQVIKVTASKNKLIKFYNYYFLLNYLAESEI